MPLGIRAAARPRALAAAPTVGSRTSQLPGGHDFSTPLHSASRPVTRASVARLKPAWPGIRRCGPRGAIGLACADGRGCRTVGSGSSAWRRAPAVESRVQPGSSSLPASPSPAPAGLPSSRTLARAMSTFSHVFAVSRASSGSSPFRESARDHFHLLRQPTNR